MWRRSLPLLRSSGHIEALLLFFSPERHNAFRCYEAAATLMKTQKPIRGNVAIAAIVRSSRRWFHTPVDMEHDGRTYSVSIDGLKAPRCEECGEVVLDDHANRQIRRRVQTTNWIADARTNPRESRTPRQDLRKTWLPYSESRRRRLSRWETGAQIQQRVMDRFLRLYFAIPNVREALADEKGMQALGVLVQHESQALAPRA